MKRNSTKTKQLVVLLSGAGIRVSSRQLEKLSHAGLLPPEGTTNAQIAAHLGVLVEVYGRGPKAADRAAFCLAYRGFGCSRLRDAIVRDLHADCKNVHDLAAKLGASSPQLVDAQTDRGLAEIEAAVNWMESDELPERLRCLVRFLVDMFRPENGLALPVIDPVTYWATGQPDTPEQVAHSYLTNLVAAGIGDGFYDDTAIRALSVNQGEGAQTAAMYGVLSEGGFYHEADRALVDASLQRLVAGTLFCRAFLSCIPHFPDDQRATVSAGMAPGFIALFDRLIAVSPATAAEMLAILGSALSGGELVTSSALA